MNTLKYDTTSLEGIELNDDWLKNNNLSGKRIFYVIKPNFEDKDIYKIGVASDIAKKRIMDYILTYGVKTTENQHKGVKLYMLLFNNYHANTRKGKSAVEILEKKVKEKLTQDGKKDRGKEWFEVTLDELQGVINQYLGVTDEATERRVGLRHNDQGGRNTVSRIEGHKTYLGEVYYRVKFKRPATGSQREMENLNVETIYSLQDGATKLSAYLQRVDGDDDDAPLAAVYINRRRLTD